THDFRLLKRELIDTGLAQSVDTSIDPYLHAGIFSIYVSATPKNAERCLERIIRQLQALRQKPISARQLLHLKRVRYAAILRDRHSIAEIADWDGHQEINLGRNLNRQYQSYCEALTPGDLQTLASRYFVGDNVVLGGLIPGDRAGQRDRRYEKRLGRL